MSSGTTDMIECLYGPVDGATIHASSIKRGKIREGIEKRLFDGLSHNSQKPWCWEWTRGPTQTDAMVIYKKKSDGFLHFVRMESP